MAGVPLRRLCGVSKHASERLFPWATIPPRPHLLRYSQSASAELGSASADVCSRSEVGSTASTSSFVSSRFPDSCPNQGIANSHTTFRDRNVCQPWLRSGIGFLNFHGAVRDGDVCQNWIGSALELAGYRKGFATESKEAKSSLYILPKEGSKFRTCRASSGLLDHITVEAHGLRTPLSHVASVTVCGLQMPNVLPSDASMVKRMENSTLNCPLGLNAQVQGSSLTVPSPRWRMFLASPSITGIVNRTSAALPSPAIGRPAAPGKLMFVRFLGCKRPKKWQGGMHAYIQVEPGEPCPPYSPNAGSVKNRKHNKRMAQRHKFAKDQAHQRKQETKAALIKRDAARRKRWREGAARVRAWAKHLEEKKLVSTISA